MIKRNKWIFSVLLIPITELLRFYAKNNVSWVEEYYSRFFYLRWMQGISSFFGIVPVSMGEVLSFIYVATILFMTIQAIGDSIAHKKWSDWIPVLRFVVVTFSVGYVIFFMHYRINFYREPLVDMDELAMDQVSDELLAEALSYYIDEANNVMYFMENTLIQTLTYDEILDVADMSFYYLPYEYRYLSGVFGEPKRLILSDLQISMGYTGMYFPFTGEPLVNANLLKMEMPFTMIHEMSHQRGIAKEEDANYIAFLGCIHSNHPFFNYSGYFNAVQYLSGELYKRDENLYQEIMAERSTTLQEDMQAVRDFWALNYNPDLGEKVDAVVEANLKNNGQEAGLQSYGQVSKYLLNYYIESKISLN